MSPTSWVPLMRLTRLTHTTHSWDSMTLLWDWLHEALSWCLFHDAHLMKLSNDAPWCSFHEAHSWHSLLDDFLTLTSRCSLLDAQSWCSLHEAHSWRSLLDAHFSMLTRDVHFMMLAHNSNSSLFQPYFQWYLPYLPTLPLPPKPHHASFWNHTLYFLFPYFYNPPLPAPNPHLYEW